MLPLDLRFVTDWRQAQAEGKLKRFATALSLELKAADEAGAKVIADAIQEALKRDDRIAAVTVTDPWRVDDGCPGDCSECDEHHQDRCPNLDAGIPTPTLTLGAETD